MQMKFINIGETVTLICFTKLISFINKFYRRKQNVLAPHNICIHVSVITQFIQMHPNSFVLCVHPYTTSDSVQHHHFLPLPMSSQYFALSE